MYDKANKLTYHSEASEKLILISDLFLLSVVYGSADERVEGAGHGLQDWVQR